MKYNPPYGSSDPNAPYVDKDVPSATVGSKVPRLGVEAPQREIVNVITRAGLIPAEGDNGQLAKAIQSFRLNNGVAGGTANAITTSLNPPLPAYAAGHEINLKVGNFSNTEPVTINVDGLGNRPVLRPDGQPLSGGDLPPQQIVKLIDNGSGSYLLQTPRPGRYRRISWIVGSAALTAADVNATYVMDLSVRQDFRLPDPTTVQIGDTVTLEVNGAPSGFQTAYVDLANPALVIIHRNANHNPMYLIGFGETLQFVSSGTAWKCYVLTNPGDVFGFIGGALSTAQPQTTVAYALPNSVNVGGGQNLLFDIPSASASRARAPVSGIYTILWQAHLISTSGGPATGQIRALSVDPGVGPVNSVTTHVSATFDIRASQTASVVAQITKYIQQGTFVWPSILGHAALTIRPDFSSLNLLLVSR